jgi:hypothetical protein
LTAFRKPEAAVEAAGGSQGSSLYATSAQQKLVSLLAMALGGAEPVQSLLSHALMLAGRDELPPTGPEIVAFVRGHLLAPLSEALGPRLTMALVDDLAAQLDPSPSSVAHASIPPSSMHRPVAGHPGRAGPSSSARALADLAVILVDPDRVGRASLARAMLRVRWQVTVVDSVADLHAVRESGEAFDAAVIDSAHPAAQVLIEALAREHPEVVVVMRSADSTRMRATLTRLGFQRFDVRSHDAPAEELIDAVKRA